MNILKNNKKDSNWSDIDKFFLQFSYSTKFRIVLIFSLLAIFTVVYENAVTRYQFISSAYKRESGAKLQKPLNSLLLNLVRYKSNRSSENRRQVLSSIIFEMSENISDLQEAQKGTFINNTLTPRWVNPKFTKQLNSIVRELNVLKDSSQKEIQKNGITENLILQINAAIKEINVNAKLLLDDDTGTLHFIKLTMELIPNLTLLLNELYDVNESYSANDPAYTTKLKFRSRELFNFITRAGQHYDLYTERNPTLSKHKDSRVLTENIKKWQGKLATLATTMEEGFIKEAGYEAINQEIDRSINNALNSTLEVQELLAEQLQELLLIQRRSETRVYLTVILLPLLPLLMIILLMYGLRRPLNELKKGTQKMLDGDLTYRIKPKAHDEVADMCKLYNRLANLLQRSFRDSDKMADVYLKKALEATSQANELQDRINAQAQGVKEVARHGNGVAQTVTHIASSLGQVSDLVKSTSLQANQGEISLVEMEDSISNMQQSADHVIVTLSSFQEKVGTTSDIINMIVRIVDQANLLSINSAINANRTGRKGVGFVIISEQIRELANQSAFFTLDIEKKIREMIPTLQDVSSLVTSFSTEIEKQSTDMKEIKDQIHGFIDLTKEQITTFKQVNDGMLLQTKRADEIDTLVHTQSELANHINRTIQELQSEVNTLHGSASTFHEIVKAFREIEKKGEK